MISRYSVIILMNVTSRGRCFFFKCCIKEAFKCNFYYGNQIIIYRDIELFTNHSLNICQENVKQ